METAAASSGHLDALNREIEAAIDPWLAHMPWRKDHAAWREGRLWQENDQANKLALLSEQVGPLAGLDILDLGCGMGGLSVAMARAGARVRPMDFEPEYCRITQLRGRRYGLDLQPVNGVGEDLPFPSHSFDAITCLDVLEHVQDPVRVLQQARRVLRPGGLLYITVVNRLAWNDPHYHLRGVNWIVGPRSLADRYVDWRGRGKQGANNQDRQRLSEMHYFTYGAIVRLARSLGFQTSEVGEAHLKARTGPLYRRRGLARRLVAIADGTGLLPVLYRAYRFGAKGTYKLLMRAPKPV